MAYKFRTTKDRPALLMKKIKSKGTMAGRLLYEKLSGDSGIRFRKHLKDLPGKPDIVVNEHKIAIFFLLMVKFGHRDSNWKRKRINIKSNRTSSLPKIEGNMRRDKRNNRVLKQLGWKVIRFWEYDIKNNLKSCSLTINKLVDGEQA